MRTTIQKWGNHLATPIPASLADQLQLNSHTIVDIRIEGDSIIITPIKKSYTLDGLLAEMDDTQPEIEWGQAVGKEVFWE